MADGTLVAVDRAHRAVLVNRGFRSGSLLGIDRPLQAILTGIIIGDSTRVGGPDSTFMQGQELSDQALTLTLWDGKVEGWTEVDGTYVDGTIWSRLYDPMWINCSLWYLTPPDGTPLVLRGNEERQPGRLDVGRYYALMYTPETTGRYELRWRYQDDEEPWAREVTQGFVVASWGVSSQPDYTGGF